MTSARILDEHIDGLSHSFRLALPRDEVDAAVDAKLRELKRTIRVSGFRPGRAPLTLLRKRHGDRLRMSVIDQLSINVAERLISEKGLKPIRRPTIRIDEGDASTSESITLLLLLEVMPTVTLAPLTGFSLTRYSVESDEPQLRELLEADLRRQVFDELISRHDFPVPGDLVETEFTRIVHGYRTEVGDDPDEEMLAELRRIASRRISLAILVVEIGRANNIEISRAEIEQLVKHQAELDPDHYLEVVDYYFNHPTALAELQSPLFESRVINFLVSQGDVKTVEQSAEEVRRTLAIE